MTVEITCEVCGRTAAHDQPLGWSAEITAGRTRWTCEACTRDNVRSIEAKLEPQWW